MEQLGKVIGREMRKPERNIRFDGADVLTRKGYTLVPNMILNHQRLSAIAKLTYVQLLKYAWNKDFCFPGQDTLAGDMGISQRHAHTALKELAKNGLISIKRQGQGKPNLYTLHFRVTSKASA